MNLFLKKSLFLAFIFTLTFGFIDDCEAAKKSQRSGGKNKSTIENFYAGALLGLGFPTETSLDIRLPFGANGGYHFNKNYSGGLFLLYTTEKIVKGVDASTFYLLLDGSLHLDQILKGLRTGLKLGLAFNSNGKSETDPTIGYHWGWEKKINDRISLGGEFNHIIIFNGASPGLVNFLVNAKFWFGK